MKESSFFRTYSSKSTLQNPIKLFIEMWKDLMQSKELAIAIARRDISAQYRQTFLGYLWAFLPVIGTAAVFLFLRSGGAFSTSEDSIPYPIYVLVGTICWQIFVDSVNGPLKVITTSKAMLSKVNFARESLIIAGMLTTLFNFVVRLLILIPSLYFFYLKGMYTFDIKSLLLFPIGVISIMCLGYTVGLLLTPIGILYTDVLMSIQMLMMFWMFVSPVVITMPTIGNVANVMRINPVTPLIETTRSWLIGINSNYLNEFFIVFGCSIIFLFVAWILYRVSLPHVVARIGM